VAALRRESAALRRIRRHPPWERREEGCRHREKGWAPWKRKRRRKGAMGRKKREGPRGETVGRRR
jgi:hypothetical protein